jgi:hypothetical protein
MKIQMNEKVNGAIYLRTEVVYPIYKHGATFTRNNSGGSLLEIISTNRIKNGCGTTEKRFTKIKIHIC